MLAWLVLMVPLRVHGPSTSITPVDTKENKPLLTYNPRSIIIGILSHSGVSSMLTNGWSLDHGADWYFNSH